MPETSAHEVDEIDDVEQFVRACRDVAGHGLVIGSAGNLSWRTAQGTVLVSPSGGELSTIGVDDVVAVDLVTGRPRRGGRPTSELDLHLQLLRRYPDVRAVVHTHSRAAAAFAVARAEIPFVCNESLATRSGAIRVSAYGPPGSSELAAAACATFDLEPGSRAILLANHGPVAVADTLTTAVRLAAQVEWVAEVYYRARLIGTPHLIEPAHQAAMAESYGSPYRPIDCSVRDDERHHEAVGSAPGASGGDGL
jgi:L-fuculose-phosphate aldolase